MHPSAGARSGTPSCWNAGSPCARVSAFCARNCPASLRRAPVPCRHACCVSSRSWQATGAGWISALSLSGKIEALARQDQACSRLMTLPGIGPIISSAVVAAIGTGDVFSKGRDFGAWLGLVPKHSSTGDRTILGQNLEVPRWLTRAFCSYRPQRVVWSG